MSSYVLDYSLSNTVFRGEQRLAYIAAADSDGRVGVSSIVYWCGCDTDEAAIILDRMVACGMFVRIGGEVVCPELLMVADHRSTSTTRSGKRQFSISSKRRATIYSRDGHACHYCGASEDLSLDHMTPQAKGGSDADDNLVTCCRSCNSAKGKKSYDEFLSWMGARAE